MTVYCYLDDVKDEDGGALYFARARPGAVRVRVRKGLAAIFYSALEDGTLDRTAAHGDAPLRPGAEAWVLALRVYDRPRPLARRVCAGRRRARSYFVGHGLASFTALQHRRTMRYRRTGRYYPAACARRKRPASYPCGEPAAAVRFQRLGVFV